MSKQTLNLPKYIILLGLALVANLSHAQKTHIVSVSIHQEGCVLLQAEQDTERATVLFPNPSKEHFVVTSALEFFGIELVTLTGKSIYTKYHKGVFSQEVSTTSLKSGTYICRVAFKDKIEQFQIIINK